MTALVYLIIPLTFLAGLLAIIAVMRNFSRLHVRKSVHCYVLAGYVGLLLIALAVGEVMERKADIQPLETIAYDEEFILEDAITEKKPIPERFIYERRLHDTAGKLAVDNTLDQAYVLIEKTEEAGNTVVETVYKPELIASFTNDEAAYYDLSGQLDIALPVWTADSMTVPRQPRNDIYYTFYHDANIAGQFTSERNLGYTSSSYSSLLIIHLLVPESVELDIPKWSDDEYGNIRVIE